jgi:hopanoid biosynthesis associated protein HpnK
MAMPELTPRRLIVNADDFGRSASINAAVEKAHREGVLTSASLMVNEPGFEEAVAMARSHPRLAVGLHLTLIQGHAALPAEEIPGLANARGEFGRNPVKLGWRYFFHSELRDQLYCEISAQLRKFHSAGLRLDHLDGHMHLHMQPAVFRLLMENAGKWGIRHFRLTCEPLRPNLRAARGHYFMRALNALVFRCLASWQRRALAKRDIRHARQVFGQLQDGRVDEAYVLGLLPHLPPGDSELYSHPSLDNFKHELDALLSPRVRELAGQLGIQFIQYQDL